MYKLLKNYERYTHQSIDIALKEIELHKFIFIQCFIKISLRSYAKKAVYGHLQRSASKKKKSAPAFTLLSRN